MLKSPLRIAPCASRRTGSGLMVSAGEGMSDLFCKQVQDWPHVVTDGLDARPRPVVVERAIPRGIDIPVPESSRSVSLPRLVSFATDGPPVGHGGENTTPL